VRCVEWNCYYVFLFICRILVSVLLVLPYHMVNKDEYIKHNIDLSAVMAVNELIVMVKRNNGV